MPGCENDISDGSGVFVKIYVLTAENDLFVAARENTSKAPVEDFRPKRGAVVCKNCYELNFGKLSTMQELEDRLKQLLGENSEVVKIARTR